MSCEPVPFRRVALATFALAFAGAACGGNYSNDDIAFINAVPNRSDLQSKLADEATQAKLVQGLAVVGQQSELFTGTQKASTDFNRALDAMLGLFEEVLKHPPSKRRGALYREWGPVPAENQPSYVWRVVIERGVDELGQPGPDFEYALQVRHRLGTEAQWADFITGTYRATGGIRRGQGTLLLTTAAVRATGAELGGLDAIDSLAVDYGTDGDPIYVSLEINARSPLGPAVARYDYTERTEGETKGAGSMRFEFNLNVVGGVLSEPERFVVTSRWLPGGAGRADATVTIGDIAAGATYVECWDAEHQLTLISKSWDGTFEGDPTSCVFGSDLP